ADIDLLTLRLPFAVLREYEPQEVGVERAAQTLVGRYHDQAHALDGVAVHEKRMPVLGIGVADVRGDGANFLSVGTRHAHALLRAAHFGRGDHLHRLGDLPGVLHTPDFYANFFCPWHIQRRAR